MYLGWELLCVVYITVYKPFQSCKVSFVPGLYSTLGSRRAIVTLVEFSLATILLLPERFNINPYFFRHTVFPRINNVAFIFVHVSSVGDHVMRSYLLCLVYMYNRKMNTAPLHRDSLVPRLSLLCTLIPCLTFNPLKRKAEGEPGTFWHVINVTLRQPRIECMVG